MTFARLLFLTLLLAGCARLNDSILNPSSQGPSFEITGETTSTGTLLFKWQIGETLSDFDHSDSAPDFKVLYAFYLYRSDTSAYEGFRLIYRMYNPYTQTTIRGTDYHVPNSSGITNLDLKSMPGRPSVFSDWVWLEIPKPSAKVYFRAIRVKLEQTTTSSQTCTSSGNGAPNCITTYHTSVSASENGYTTVLAVP